MVRVLDRLLIVADDQSVCIFLNLVAERLGFQVRMAATTEAFAMLLADFRPTAIVLDLNLPGTSGTELLRDLAEQSSPAQIFLTSDDDTKVLQAAENLGVLHGLRMAGVLQKPLLLDDIERAFGGVLGEPASVGAPAVDAGTGLFQQFDAGKFDTAQKALAAAEAAFTAALEIGRTVLVSDKQEETSETGVHTCYPDS